MSILRYAVTGAVAVTVVLLVPVLPFLWLWYRLAEQRPYRSSA